MALLCEYEKVDVGKVIKNQVVSPLSLLVKASLSLDMKNGID